eukprot:GHUV01032682.1.p1 GENE.GHUV01032682.1~~GHUV01032682.1.p1  ORF type:complete len:113 (-),score=25.61 GHUV01032682.1:732-1070(-)
MLSRPGDVLQTRAGLTVENGNTDAEGRLILCDAIFEAAQEKPDVLIDAATLTGTSVVSGLRFWLRMLMCVRLGRHQLLHWKLFTAVAWMSWACLMCAADCALQPGNSSSVSQ